MTMQEILAQLKGKPIVSKTTTINRPQTNFTYPQAGQSGQVPVNNLGQTNGTTGRSGGNLLGQTKASLLSKLGQTPNPKEVAPPEKKAQDSLLPPAPPTQEPASTYALSTSPSVPKTQAASTSAPPQQPIQYPPSTQKYWFNPRTGKTEINPNYKYKPPTNNSDSYGSYYGG